MNRFYLQAVILFLYCFFSGVCHGQNKKNRTAMRFFSILAETARFELAGAKP